MKNFPTVSFFFSLRLIGDTLALLSESAHLPRSSWALSADG